MKLTINKLQIGSRTHAGAPKTPPPSASIRKQKDL